MSNFLTALDVVASGACRLGVKSWCDRTGFWLGAVDGALAKCADESERRFILKAADKYGGYGNGNGNGNGNGDGDGNGNGYGYGYGDGNGDGDGDGNGDGDGI